MSQAGRKATFEPTPDGGSSLGQLESKHRSWVAVSGVASRGQALVKGFWVIVSVCWKEE